ncbi:MAG: hypothetical protein WBN62_08245 [Thermoanaerobaculia bacterium]
MQVHLIARFVDAVAGEAGHRAACSHIDGFLADWMANRMFMGVTLRAELDGVLPK